MHLKPKWDGRKRHPRVAKSKFEYWILETGGTEQVSLLLGVHQMTVINWLNRKTQPPLAIIIRILKLAPQLSLEDVAKGTLP